MFYDVKVIWIRTLFYVDLSLFNTGNTSSTGEIAHVHTRILLKSLKVIQPVEITQSPAAFKAASTSIQISTVLKQNYAQSYFIHSNIWLTPLAKFFYFSLSMPFTLEFINLRGNLIRAIFNFIEPSEPGPASVLTTLHTWLLHSFLPDVRYF